MFYENFSLSDSTVLQSWTCMLVDICEIWQKALVRELAKSAYFRSASSESDNK